MKVGFFLLDRKATPSSKLKLLHNHLKIAKARTSEREIFIRQQKLNFRELSLILNRLSLS